MKIFHFSLLLSIISFYSCDILRTIQFENKSGEDVSIHYFIIENPDSIFLCDIQLPKSNENPSGIRQFLTEEEIQEYINIKQMHQNIYSINCGMNKFWTDEEIRKYIRNIQKIEIITPKETIILEREKLFQYLKKHRNFCKNKILINIAR
jgi:hypothetical protein